MDGDGRSEFWGCWLSVQPDTTWTLTKGGVVLRSAFLTPPVEPELLLYMDLCLGGSTPYETFVKPHAAQTWFGTSRSTFAKLNVPSSSLLRCDEVVGDFDRLRNVVHTFEERADAIAAYWITKLPKPQPF